MASPLARSEPPWHAAGHQETAWNLGVLQNLEKRPSAHLMRGIDKVRVHQSMLCFRKPGHICDSYCISQEKGSLQTGQLMENSFTDLSIFGGKGGWMMIPQFYVLLTCPVGPAEGAFTQRREFCVCSSQHPRASAPAAGNSSLTRIHLQHSVCKHSDGFIRLNLWCKRHLAFLVCAWTSHLNCIVMSDNKMFPCCHSTFPITGCFKNCYKICSCWNVAAVIWSKNS